MADNFVSFSPENVEIMRRCRELLDEYNSTGYDDGDKRTALLQDLLGSCGEDATIQTPFKITYGKHLHIGSHRCPKFAIQYGNGKATQAHGQYTNPHVKV